MHKKTDLRVKRTHIMLRESLIDLIAEKGFDSVTVGDIADRAMVNRATFYRHYQDKYALVTSIFEDTAEQVINEIGPLERRMETIYWITNEVGTLKNQPMSAEVEQQISAFSTLFEHFSKNAKLYKTMLGKKGSSWFTAQMRDYIAKVLYQRLQTSQLPDVKKIEIQEIGRASCRQRV